MFYFSSLLPPTPHPPPPTLGTEQISCVLVGRPPHGWESQGEAAIFKSVEFIINTLRKLGIKWGGGRDFLYLLRAFTKKKLQWASYLWRKTECFPSKIRNKQTWRCLLYTSLVFSRVLEVLAHAIKHEREIKGKFSSPFLRGEITLFLFADDMTVWVSNPKKSIKSLLESSVKVARYHISIKNPLYLLSMTCGHQN